MDFEWMQNGAILKELGRRVRRTRLSWNITQKALAEDAGISLNSIKNMEAGKGYRMESLISVLRILKGINSLDTILPDPPEFDLLVQSKMRKEMEKKKRKRATGN